MVSLADLPDFEARHVLPSLSLGDSLRGLPHSRVLDVGSGAGLPGVPLAIAFPSSSFTLIESRRKRANFLRHVVRTLELPNVTVVCNRVEQWVPVERFEIIVSRAVTDLASLAEMTHHCRTPSGFLVVTAGPQTARRTEGMRSSVRVAEGHRARTTIIVAHPTCSPKATATNVETVVD